MIAYQLSIFAEDKPGKIAHVTSVSSQSKNQHSSNNYIHIGYLWRDQPDRGMIPNGRRQL